MIPSRRCEVSDHVRPLGNALVLDVATARVRATGFSNLDSDVGGFLDCAHGKTSTVEPEDGFTALTGCRSPAAGV